MGIYTIPLTPKLSDHLSRETGKTMAVGLSDNGYEYWKMAIYHVLGTSQTLCWFSVAMVWISVYTKVHVPKVGHYPWAWLGGKGLFKRQNLVWEIRSQRCALEGPLGLKSILCFLSSMRWITLSAMCYYTGPKQQWQGTTMEISETMSQSKPCWF